MAPKALIVDDSRSSQAILSKLLQQYGYTTSCSDSGESGLEQIRRLHFDVIFLDHTLPGKNGLEILEIIQADNAVNSIPVVMYTAQEGEEYLQRAKMLGASAVLSKNLKEDSLNDILNSINLSNTRQKPTTGSATTSAVETSKPAPAPAATSTTTNNNDPKPVTAVAQAQKIKSTRATKSAHSDIDNIFNRAKYDHLTHKVSLIQNQQTQQFKWLIAALLTLFLFTMWLTITELMRVDTLGTQTTNNNITNSAKISGDMEQQLDHQRQQIESLKRQLSEQQQNVLSLKDTQVRLVAQQQDLQTNVSRAETQIEDLRYSELTQPQDNRQEQSESSEEVIQTTRDQLDNDQPQNDF